MATKIKMSASDIDNIIARIRAQLQAKKCTESTLNVVAVPTKDHRTATLYITPAAWCKMAGLVAEYGTEVEWHGLARRISECEYEIYDVLVFPHEVTGTTVVADQTKYTEWIESLDDDTFNELKMHGHSICLRRHRPSMKRTVLTLCRFFRPMEGMTRSTSS